MLLSFLQLQLPLLSVLGYGSRIPHPLVEFHLLREDCLLSSGIFPDSAEMDLLGGMQRDDLRSRCLRGNGVAAIPNAAQGRAALSSTGDIGSIMPFFRGSELSLEFWVRSNDSTVSDTGILAFAMKDSLSPYAIKLEQRSVSASFLPGRMNIKAQNMAGSVIVLESSRLNAGEYSHVVIDMRYISPMFAGKAFSMVEKNTTVNATRELSVSDGSFSGSYDVALWNPTFFLQFFSSAMKTNHQLSENFWPGELLFFAIYNRTLSRSEVRSNYIAGLPNSLPVVWPTRVNIQEDGQHINSIVFYADIPIEDVSAIQLPVFDVDDTFEHPNFNRSEMVHLYTVAYITRLPSKGTLYSPVFSSPYTLAEQAVMRITSWEPITSVPCALRIGAIAAADVVNLMSDVYAPLGLDLGSGIIAGHFVKYRPAKDEFSEGGLEYTNFEISAIDGATLKPSHEISTIAVVVSAVNDPPSADSITTEVYATVPEILLLSGSDVDSDVGGALITRLPALGSLYHVHTDGSVAYDSPIVLVPTVLWAMSVAYVYTGPQNNNVLGMEQYIEIDNFEFRVFDSVVAQGETMGLLSLAAEAILRVLPAVYAIAQPAAVALESVEVVIPLYGIDMSDARRSLQIEITDTPLRGRIFDYVTGIELKRGSILSTPIAPDMYKNCAKPVNLTYIGDPYFFSVPKARHNGSIIPSSVEDIFSYRLRTFGSAYSPVEIQGIVVRNRNHATNISAKYPSNDMTEYSIFQIGSDAVGDYKSEIEVFGFSLTDMDQDTDIMRLSIVTGGGLIDLNPAYVGFLFFNGLNYCRQPNWQCKGNGVDDRVIDAVGTAFHIKNALNGLIFRSTLSEYTDIVNISIHDGAGGKCVSPTVLNSDTFQTGCHTTTVSIRINVLPFPSKHDNINPGYITDQYFPIRYLIVLLLVILICCCLCCCCKCLCRKQEDKYLKAGFVAPAHIRRKPFPFNLCFECNVYPVGFGFTQKKTKKNQVDRDSLESQVSLDDVNVEVEGEQGVPPCHWIPCDNKKRGTR